MLCCARLVGGKEVAAADRQRWSPVFDKKSVAMRPEKSEDRPRFRFDRTISSNKIIVGSLALGLTLSRSPMNSLNAAFHVSNTSSV
jgi:hypothetical protein